MRFNSDSCYLFYFILGDIASFGNRRVLHGRTSYSIEAGASQERYLQGTYIDLDEVNSRRRVLKQKLNMDMYQY